LAYVFCFGLPDRRYIDVILFWFAQSIDASAICSGA